jgi:metal-dependent amidase/aminoacylase/carboxypeptidase family protein
MSARDRAVLAAVRERGPTVLDVAHFVQAHPELAYEEYQCARYLLNSLSEMSEAEEGLDGMPTGFRATVRGAEPGPTVGLVAVYDAVGVVRENGALEAVHSCGHGPVSGAVVGAALALAALREQLSGTVIVIGCPADELVSPKAILLGSGKSRAIENGALAGIDFALYPHPESHTGVWHASRWMQLFELHVAEDYEVSQWSLPFDEYRLDSVNTAQDGSTRLVVRVLGDDLQMIEERAATAHSSLAPLSWTPLGLTEGLVSDPRVVDAVEDALGVLGLAFEAQTPVMPFSTDFGNVSRRLPSAMIGVSREGGWGVHTDQGAELFSGTAGDEVAVTMSEILVLAADRLLRAAGPG